METAPSIDSTEPTPCEPSSLVVEVRSRGIPVLRTGDDDPVLPGLSIGDRALVTAALSRAVAMNLNALANDIHMLAEPAGSA